MHVCMYIGSVTAHTHNAMMYDVVPDRDRYNTAVIYPLVVPFTAHARIHLYSLVEVRDRSFVRLRSIERGIFCCRGIIYTHTYNGV